MGASKGKLSPDKEFEKDLKYMFNLFDTNGDKCITMDELGNLLSCGSVQMTDEEIQRAMSDIDKNGDGKITYKEFRKYMVKQLRRSMSAEETEAEVRQAFRLFDIDGNGYIDKSELHEVLTSIGGDFPADCLDPIISYVDKNNDGRIDFEEFVVLWAGMQDDIQKKARAACK